MIECFDELSLFHARYYRIEGQQQEKPAASPGEGGLDAQGFDAKRYFDGMVSTGKLPDMVKKSQELDVEIKDWSCAASAFSCLRCMHLL